MNEMDPDFNETQEDGEVIAKFQELAVDDENNYLNDSLPNFDSKQEFINLFLVAYSWQQN